MATFDIRLRTGTTLHPDCDPSDYVSVYTGVILYSRERDGRVFKAGRVKAYRIHAGLAERGGESTFDVCDAYSQELHEVYAALFDAKTDDLKDDVRDGFDAIEPDVLVLDYVLLHPRWRGLRLGLLAARKLIDLLGGGCGLTVAHIAPLYAGADEFTNVPAGWVPRHANKEERHEAVKKLRGYFRRMGFRRIAGTRFHGLSMSQIVPTLAELLRPTK